MTAAFPRLAASLILLRDDIAYGLRVLMQVRSKVMSFAAGALVFPGGGLEDDDASLAESMADNTVPELRDSVVKDLALKIAAIRETFEECGILLADREDGTELVPEEAVVLWRIYKSQAPKIGFGDLLAREGLRPRVQDLQRFAHWITPIGRPKRFDTHFFIARYAGQERHLVGNAEVQELKWLPPRWVTSGALDLSYKLMFPTRMNLMRLAVSDNVDDVFTLVAENEIVTIAPEYILQADGNVLLRVPPEAGLGEEFFPVDDPPVQR